MAGVRPRLVAGGVTKFQFKRSMCVSAQNHLLQMEPVEDVGKHAARNAHVGSDVRHAQRLLRNTKSTVTVAKRFGS